MSPLTQLRHDLQTLGLTDAAEVLDQVLDTATRGKQSYTDFLAELLGMERRVRRQRYLKARTRLPHLPFHKTLADFDFGYQPSLDEGQIRELASLSFAEQAHNVILLGQPGEGKTHLAVSLAMECIMQGLGVYFVTAHALVEDLRRAHAENRLERRMRVYLGPKVLIIDEVGYIPFGNLAATMLFQLVSARYGRGSIILTSNKSFARRCSRIPSSLPPSWTGCCTTRTSSIFAATVTGLRRRGGLESLPAYTGEQTGPPLSNNRVGPFFDATSGSILDRY